MAITLVSILLTSFVLPLGLAVRNDVASDLESRSETDTSVDENQTNDVGEEFFVEAKTGDGCEWAKLDLSGGVTCTTLKMFPGGMQGNTGLVRITGGSYGTVDLVLKQQSASRGYESAFEALVNEKDVARELKMRQFTKMPEYYFNFKVDPRYAKYKNAHLWTVRGQRAKCNRGERSSACEVNPQFSGPDNELLGMEFLEGFGILKDMKSLLARESPFRREVRAAALFLAYNQMVKAGIDHCDFNAGNAMFHLKDPLEVRIIDFGLARVSRGPTEEAMPGKCEGKLADIGSSSGGGGTGALWDSFYRGHQNIEQMMFFPSNNPWGTDPLVSGQPLLEVPGTNLEVYAFYAQTGNAGYKYKEGGEEKFVRETRFSGMVSWMKQVYDSAVKQNNWPVIVKYSEFLIKLYGSDRARQIPNPSRVQKNHMGRIETKNYPQPRQPVIKTEEANQDWWTRDADGQPPVKKHKPNEVAQVAQKPQNRGQTPNINAMRDIRTKTDALKLQEGTLVAIKETDDFEFGKIGAASFGGNPVDCPTTTKCGFWFLPSDGGQKRNVLLMLPAGKLKAA